MLMKDPKKSLALIISSKMKKPDNMEAPKSENGGEDDKSIGYHTAAEEILKAIETKSAKALSEALKSHYEMCESEEEPEEPSEPESEQP